MNILCQNEKSNWFFLTVETINFSFDEPPTLSGEDVLPGFVLDLTPILNP
jgi:hypothetical protein